MGASIVRYLTAFSATVAILLLSGCQTAPLSFDQAIYNACVASYNRDFLRLPNNRAMVSGSGYGSTKCFWTWNAPSQQSAIDRATADCQREKGSCTLFADNNGLRDWSRRISNNGGVDPDIRRQTNGTSSTISQGVAQGIMNGIGAANQVRASGRSSVVQTPRPISTPRGSAGTSLHCVPLPEGGENCNPIVLGPVINNPLPPTSRGIR